MAAIADLNYIGQPHVIFASLLGSVLVYSICLGLYRILFHPLRKIPGLKLAAFTGWLETYYECFKPPGGQFMWEYQKWHETYGPIVRIGPNEVHIQDPAFYEVLYAQSRHSDKLKALQYRFNNPTAAFTTAEHHIHRVRRSALNPFFSKRRITQHAPNIQAHMERLCERVRNEYLDRDNILQVNNMWGAFTSDLIVNYCFEKPYDFILNPDFRAEFSNAMADLLDPVHFATQFPWLFAPLTMLPDWLVIRLSPPMKSVIAFNAEMDAQISHARAVHAAGEKAKDGPQSMFTALFDSDLPPSELEPLRLQHEAISVIGAGIETTMYCLSTCTYHLLANPAILARLRAELQTAIPDPARIPDLDALMQLPYLTCVINEALRFTYGTPQRLPRTCPTPVVYTAPNGGGKEYILPVGTVISMDNYTASHDPTIFPEPYAFRPDRWEGNPAAPDGKPLTRYLVAFGRGTRSCLGIQLAYAELYIGLATFFRRFSGELVGTTREDDVDCYRDVFFPRAKPGSKGVRIKVTRAE